MIFWGFWAAIVILTGTIIEEQQEKAKMKVWDIKDKIKDFSLNPPKDKSDKRLLKMIEDAVEMFKNPEEKIQFHLAPKYGNLSWNSLKEIDDSLKAMMGGILEMNIDDKKMSWDELISTLDKYPLLVKKPELSTYKLGRVSFRHVSTFGIEHHHIRRSKMIRTWFTWLIENADILKETDINLNDLEKVASRISKNIGKEIVVHKTKKIKLMDIGILRFPDIETPYFSVYRINLMAKSSYKKYLTFSKEYSDLIGLFQKEIYHPNQDYIDNLSEEIMDDLLQEVDHLFTNKIYF